MSPEPTDWKTFVQQHGRRPVRYAAFAQVVEALRVALERNKALEQRIAALEFTGLKFCGVWTAGHAYSRGSACTHAGGLWIATEPTRARPGAAGDGWTLAVKRGAVTP